MKRREFIGGMAAALAGWPPSAFAQPQSRRRQLGVLLIGTPESRAAQMVDYARWLDELGWKKATNLDLEYRWVSGNPQDLRMQAAELAAFTPDAILVEGTYTVAAMRQAAPSVPIVFVMVGDPIASGFVNSFAHPGGTITGFTNFEASMGGKWLEVLKEAAPATTTVAVLMHPDQVSHQNYWQSAEAAARVLRVGLTKLELRTADDIARGFAALPAAAGQGLTVLPHLITASHRTSIIQLAARQSVPAVYGVRFFAKDGGLISYGVDSQDLFRRGFGYVDRILRGEKPSDLPVQAPVMFELVINLKTAKALGLEGNVTGLSIQTTDLVGKRLELLREVVPGLRRLAILANVGNPASVLEMGEAQATARTLGLEVITSEIRRAEDIAPAFEAFKGRADALFLCADPLVNTNRTRINILAVGVRLPTMYGFREYVEAGGLMSYGSNVPDLYRRAAEYVDKILRGTKPVDIPVEQPTKFDFVINLTTAKALGLDVPPTLLARADEVIE